MSPSRGSSCPRIEPNLLRLPILAGGFFTTRATWEAPWWAEKAKILAITKMVISQVSSESLGQATKCGSLASHGKELKSKPY